MESVRLGSESDLPFGWSVLQGTPIERICCDLDFSVFDE